MSEKTVEQLEQEIKELELKLAEAKKAYDATKQNLVDTFMKAALSGLGPKCPSCGCYDGIHHSHCPLIKPYTQ